MDRYIIQSFPMTKRVRLQTDENVDALYKYLDKNYFIYQYLDKSDFIYLYLDNFFYVSTTLYIHINYSSSEHVGKINSVTYGHKRKRARTTGLSLAKHIGKTLDSQEPVNPTGRITRRALSTTSHCININIHDDVSY
jgi:hypothetical protein